jgi:DNA-binding NtrC family response regulator
MDRWHDLSRPLPVDGHFGTGRPRRIARMPEKSPALRVLLVEDEFLLRWSMAETLADAGHDVIEAGDAAAARHAVSAAVEPIDALLLDYRLPDSNGLALLGELRRLSPRSAVVMMTAHGTPELVAEALGMGAQRVLFKPFDMHALPGIVADLCHVRHQEGIRK